MALFDVIDDISEKNILKTETGDNRIFGVLIGVVVDNYNEKRAGRICVSIHTRDENANILKWARVAMPYMGKEWGHFFLPEIGDQVLVVFEQGNIEKPYVIGCIPKDNDTYLKKVKDEKNQHKKIRTKHGNTLYFQDATEGDGINDKIQLFTSGDDNKLGAHSLELDNEKKVIRLKDAEEKCKVEMLTEQGVMNIKADKKITIKAGEKITIVLNGENGKITINTTDVDLAATGQMKLNATNKGELSAGTMNVNASGQMKLNANGMLTASGSLIKLG